jgi:xanthine dehydrogenase YagT iron-sulfur-binding subunit
MSEQMENARSGISRRAFLKGSGVAAAATALGTAPPQILADDPPSAQPAGNAVAVGPGPAQIELTVDGKKFTTKLEPRVTLLDALRNHLDVTGCKRVCDRGTCGACTVLVDGRTIYACSMLALEARGKEIRTVESMNADGKLDAVPAAFAKFDAQQCGFCTPGFVVSLRAALDKNPKATAVELEHAVSGNICRCGTYEQMRHAIASLCEQKKGG